jgi:putative N6-adenine-specific DNA methylase
VSNVKDAYTKTMFVSIKVMDAIADQFRNKFGARPSVDTNNPTLRINIHIFKQDCTVSIDSSGSSLHKHGYRINSNKVPFVTLYASFVTFF